MQSFISDVVFDIKKNYETYQIPKQNRVFVIGDLNVDNVVENIILGQNKPTFSKKKVGGTGYNACLAIKNTTLTPILFGKIGNDCYGKMILTALDNNNIHALISIDDSKPTCLCNILYSKDDNFHRTIFYDPENANDYDLKNLKKTIDLLHINEDDYIFISGYFFPQLNYNMAHCRKLFEMIKNTQAMVIFDIVPHKLYEQISFKALNICISDFCFYAVIGEFHTFMKFINNQYDKLPSFPDDYHYEQIADKFNSKFYICRYGYDNISHQSIFYQKKENGISFFEKNKETGYNNEPLSKRKAYGDKLTAEILSNLVDNEEVFA